MTGENIWPEHRDRLAGGWKCVSFEMYNSDDPSKRQLIAKPHGEEPLGRALLSRNGFLSAHVANPQKMKPLPSGKPWQAGEDAEIANVARGVSMYCGYLQLFKDDEGLYWRTRVEVSSDPSRLGGIEERRVRYYDEGGKAFMVLQPVQDMILEDGTICRAELKWEKFE